MPTVPNSGDQLVDYLTDGSVGSLNERTADASKKRKKMKSLHFDVPSKAFNRTTFMRDQASPTNFAPFTANGSTPPPQAMAAAAIAESQTPKLRKQPLRQSPLRVAARNGSSKQDFSIVADSEKNQKNEDLLHVVGTPSKTRTLLNQSPTPRDPSTNRLKGLARKSSQNSTKQHMKNKLSDYKPAPLIFSKHIDQSDSSIQLTTLRMHDKSQEQSAKVSLVDTRNLQLLANGRITEESSPSKYDNVRSQPNSRTEVLKQVSRQSRYQNSSQLKSNPPDGGRTSKASQK